MGDIVPIRIKKGPDKGKVTQGATSWATRWPDRFELVKPKPASVVAKPASKPVPDRSRSTKTKKGGSE